MNKQYVYRMPHTVLYSETDARKARYSDLDQNRHVNNTRSETFSARISLPV